MSMRERLILGIESSCDETACAVVLASDNAPARVLSSIVASQHNLHAEYGGVVPEIASRAHVEALLPALREALGEAGIGLGRIDAIAVGHRPGLIGSLLVGVAGAKALAWALRKPLVGVDHVRAHLYSGVLDRANEPPFPALGLVISGGHTSLYDVRSWQSVSRIGTTIDDAAGEAFDKVAAMLTLPHPGGPAIDGLAREEGANDRAFDLPVSRLTHDSLDFSFSGLKTAVLYTLRGVPGHERATTWTHEMRRDLAASFQRAVARALTIKIERACERASYRTLLVGGGVSANTHVRSALTSLATARRMEIVLPALTNCVDNAAMIAGLGGTLLQDFATFDPSMLTLEAHPAGSEARA